MAPPYNLQPLQPTAETTRSNSNMEPFLGQIVDNFRVNDSSNLLPCPCSKRYYPFPRVSECDRSQDNVRHSDAQTATHGQTARTELRSAGRGPVHVAARPERMRRPRTSWFKENDMLWHFCPARYPHLRFTFHCTDYTVPPPHSVRPGYLDHPIDNRIDSNPEN